MIIDAQLQFSDAQALTATAVSTNLIDLGSDRNIGIGEAMAIVVGLDVVADDTTGDETYVVTVQTDDNAAFSSATTIGTITITRGDVAGTRYTFLLPKGTDTEQYLRLNHTLGGTTPTVTLTSFLVPADAVDATVDYASGFTVS